MALASEDSEQVSARVRRRPADFNPLMFAGYCLLMQMRKGHKELNRQHMSADGFKIAFWQKNFLVSLLSACLAAFV